jgi:tetratricopeptide (TPR) repeat protein
VLVCLEDLHAADEANLLLFQYLTRKTRRLPLMLVASYRNEEAPGNQPLAQKLAAKQRERLVQHVHVEALGRAATDRLLTSLLDGSVSHGLSESLFGTTGGNPLFVEQLVLALSETGQLRRRGGVWHGTTDLQGTPQIVREVIAQRLQRLGGECRGTLAMAAVLGQTFEHPVLLAALEPVEESSVLQHLDEAITAQVLRETPSGYGFGHAFLRDAVYWDLNAPRRTLLHARAAESLERFRGPHADDYAAELAHHYTLGGASTPIRTKALHYNRLAGQRAAELSSNPESLLHFQMARDIIEKSESIDLDVRIEVLIGCGWAEAMLALYPNSVATNRQVLALSNDPVLRGRARKVIAFSLSHTGAVNQVIAECEAGLAEIADIGPDGAETRAVLQQLIGLMWYRQGQFRKILQLGVAMEQEAAGADPGPQLLAHKVTGWGYMGLGQVDQAIEQYEIAVAKAEQWPDKSVLANAYETLGLQEYLGGRFAAARARLATSLRIFHESANELRAVGSLHTLCRVLLAEGEHVLARQQILEALDLELEGQERWAADAHHILGAIHVVRAEWEEASANFEHALRIRNEAGDMPGIVEATVALGFVEQCTGRLDSAASRYLGALRVSEGMDPSPHRVLVLRHLGRLHLLVGDLANAAIEIGEALDLAETMADTLEYAPTVLAMAEMRVFKGQLEEALALASTSLKRTRPVDHLVEAHVVLTNIQLARGDASAAATHAAEALSYASRLGSPRLLSLANRASAQTAMSLEPGRANSATAKR